MTARNTAARRRPWIAILGVGLVALLVIVAVALLNPGQGAPTGSTPASPGATPSAQASVASTAPSASDSIAPSSSPSSSSSTAATPAAREGWRSVQVAEAGGSAGINGVAPWAEGLMAYGRSESVEGGIWLSTDGETWVPADVPDSPSGTAVYITDIERVPGGYVAVGALGHPEGSGPMGTVVWTSPDGRAWSEAPGSAGVRNTLLSVLTAQADTVIAGGIGVWRSTDGGSTWSQVDAPSGDSWGVTGLLSFEGGFIAAGGIGDSFGVQDAAIWTSPDGAAWTRIDLEADGVSDIAVLPDGRLLAIGEGGNVAAAWLSSDGLTWTPTPADIACCVTDLASTPTGAVGVGFGPTPGGVVAATTDGVAWLSETGVEGVLNGVMYDDRFGVVAGGATTANAPAVIFGPHPYP